MILTPELGLCKAWEQKFVGGERGSYHRSENQRQTFLASCQALFSPSPLYLWQIFFCCCNERRISSLWVLKVKVSKDWMDFRNMATDAFHVTPGNHFQEIMNQFVFVHLAGSENCLKEKDDLMTWRPGKQWVVPSNFFCLYCHLGPSFIRKDRNGGERWLSGQSSCCSVCSDSQTHIRAKQA